MGFSYPSRSKKNCSIEQFKKDFLQTDSWLAGRVVGLLEDGFVLQDDSGRIDIVFEPAKFAGVEFDVGYIVEVSLSGEKILLKNNQEIILFKALQFNVLAPCVADFFIRKEDPNYKKMIVDLNLKDLLVQRSQLIQKIREFFLKQDFLETDTPFLVRLPGMEPYLDIFKTQFFADAEKKDESENMYLITSPEYALKKLLVSGFEKIFQIAKSFRNKETNSNLHNPEFTLLEWYRAYASYLEIMKDTEKLVQDLAVQTTGKSEIVYQGTTIDVSYPWTRLKVQEAFLKYAGVSKVDFEDVEKFRMVVKIKGYQVNENTTYDDMFFLVFLNEIEPKLGFDKPVILYEYPLSMAALSKICADNPKYAERFEVYIAGMEIANAFSELNDPVEQNVRLEQERKERQKLQKDDYVVDRNFIEALEYGMPPSGGIALGVDRLIMLLTDTPDIRNILFFPQRDL